MGRLLIVRGAEPGIEYELGEVTLIGRSSQCTIQIMDTSVSRQHARISRKDRSHILESLSSSGGVLLNGAPVLSPARLSDNDEIAIGEVAFVFNPSITLVRARYGDQVLVISPHRPERIETGAPGGEASPREGTLRALAAVYEKCLLEEDTARCLAEVLRETVAFFSAQRGFIVRFMGEGCDLVSAVGGEKNLVVSRTIVETIRRTGRLIVCRDASRDVELGRGLSIVEGKLRTVVCAPLTGGGGVLGFLQVDSTLAPGRLPADARFFLEKIAPAVGRRIGAPPRAAAVQGEAPPDFVAVSRPMKRLLGDIERAAASSSTCLVIGETGTGKELVARMIHERSGRRGGPFVAVNCAAIPETIIESELFGYEKGSFTGAVRSTPGKVEIADGGTLFLDEIGDMSPYAQAKLLRFLQERVFYRIGAKRYTKVDVRVVAATNRDPRRLVAEGRFREDLYWRVAVVPLEVPPLRERREDIPVLARHFLELFSRELKRPAMSLPPAFVERLQAHDWPGNVRELRNMMERFVVLGQVPDGPSAAAQPAGDLDEGERRRIVEALRRSRGNKSKAAADMGISRPTLDARIRRYDIDIFRS